MTEALYYQYWGKADESLQAAYCSRQAKEAILAAAKFMNQLFKRLKNPRTQNRAKSFELVSVFVVTG